MLSMTCKKQYFPKTSCCIHNLKVKYYKYLFIDIMKFPQWKKVIAEDQVWQNWQKQNTEKKLKCDGLSKWHYFLPSPEPRE